MAGRLRRAASLRRGSLASKPAARCPPISKAFKAGIRQMTAAKKAASCASSSTADASSPRGGNWGFGESMLRYRAREYDAAVRYHREMNFTMIRNWVGQIGDDAFYEACDRHGIVVWQDFWLANPWDGPDPDDNALFLATRRTTSCASAIMRPSASIAGATRVSAAAARERASAHCLAESASRTSTTSAARPTMWSAATAPTARCRPSFYFRAADTKLHSEIGAPNIPSIESVRAMMPEQAMWPQGLDWGLHDFCLQGRRAARVPHRPIDESYGGATNAEEWMSLAQFVNYEAYRAMFEAQSSTAWACCCG